MPLAASDASFAGQPAASPIRHHGIDGGVGVLMIHGLTASPTEVAPLVEYLRRHEPQWTLSAPLLPGHGTVVDDLRRTTPADWLAHARGELDRLTQRCRSIATVGVSMGAVLAARLALENERVAAVGLLAPTFGLSRKQSVGLQVLRCFRWDLPKRRESVEKHWRNGLFSYDRYPIRTLLQLNRFGRETLERLPSLRAPTLLAAGRFDRYVTWDRFESLRGKFQQAPLTFVECADSGHVLPHEPDAERVFAGIRELVASAARPIE